MSSETYATRVLCIEDDLEMIDLIRLILERKGIKVQSAVGGKQALEILSQDPLPDLILLDLMMPDMDGWIVYQRLKADVRTAHIPVIVVTARAQSIDRLIGLQIAKVNDYIVKPFSPHELLASVEKVLTRRTA